MKLIVKKITTRYLWLIILLGITIFTFWTYSLPARFDELRGLDSFYLYRISEYVLTHNFQLPAIDTLRYYPMGVNVWQYDLPPLFYIPLIFYLALLFFGINMPYFSFAIIYPAIMGALCIPVAYFIGKEIFNDKKAGLFAAFFLAVSPGFITRIIGESFEKETVGAVFMLLSFYFFIKAYKSNSWKFGILAGVNLAILTGVWGGAQFLYIFYPLFVFILLLFNKYSESLLKAYIPMILIGFAVSQIFPFTADVLGFRFLVSLGVLIILILRFFTEKFNLIKKEQLPYFTPCLTICIFVGLLMGAIFSEFIWGLFQTVYNLATFHRGVIGSTVAEQIPGDWNEIIARLGNGMSIYLLPQLGFLANYFSLWIFMVLGICLISYKFYKNKDWLLLLPIIWAIIGVWAVFWYVRLIFFLSIPASIISGYLLAELINQAGKFKKFEGVKNTDNVLLATGGLFLILTIASAFINILISIICAIIFIPVLLLGYLIKNSKVEIKINLLLLPLFIFLVFTLAINSATGYMFSNSMGPSFNQYWKESMDFLATQTPPNSAILSWWDFGYWFQTKGNRPSVADGGNLGGPYGERDYKIAGWFTSPPANWTDLESRLKNWEVSYILMDYTLPGKYGAISKIGSYGKQIIGILQFQQSGVYPKENKTIYEYSYGPYAIWIPVANGNLARDSPPLFLVSQNNQYVGRAYINDMCTTTGIFKFEAKEPSMGGCVTITPIGVYYIPQEAENTIFTTLMFMDGYGLPLEKVFDNYLIKIYKVNYS